MNPFYTILLFVIAYLFGSFPSAYLMVKWVLKKDIRQMGSGNVGALNVLQSTRNFLLGITVLLIDIVKGFLPAYYVTSIQHVDLSTLLVVVSGVLFGHIHPVWLKFRGGRGLAVTAGALLAIKPILVAIWLVLWIIFYIFIRNYTIVTLIATFLLPIIVFFTTDWLFGHDVLLMILPVCMLVFFRHLEGVYRLVKTGTSKNKER